MVNHNNVRRIKEEFYRAWSRIEESFIDYLEKRGEDGIDPTDGEFQELNERAGEILIDVYRRVVSSYSMEDVVDVFLDILDIELRQRIGLRDSLAGYLEGHGLPSLN